MASQNLSSATTGRNSFQKTSPDLQLLGISDTSLPALATHNSMNLLRRQCRLQNTYSPKQRLMEAAPSLLYSSTDQHQLTTLLLQFSSSWIASSAPHCPLHQSICNPNSPIPPNWLHDEWISEQKRRITMIALFTTCLL